MHGDVWRRYDRIKAIRFGRACCSDCVRMEHFFVTLHCTPRTRQHTRHKKGQARYKVHVGNRHGLRLHERNCRRCGDGIEDECGGREGERSGPAPCLVQNSVCSVLFFISLFLFFGFHQTYSMRKVAILPTILLLSRVPLGFILQMCVTRAYFDLWARTLLLQK